MLRKHWQFPILFALLVCVHSVCPLFCAAFGQTLCSSNSQVIEAEHTAIGASCCHKVKTGTPNESETPSDTETACCLNDLELVLPDNLHTVDTARESVDQSLVSVAALTTISSISQEILLHHSRPPKLSTSSLNYTISRRGPPYIRS